MAKILLIGSSGFICSNFCRKFAFECRDLHSIAGIDNFSYPWSSKSFYSKSSQSFHIANATDPLILEHIFHKEQPEVVIHGANISSDAISNNVFATQHIIDKCVKHKSKLIFLSSGELYDCPGNRPTETYPIQPSTTFGASLGASEVLVRAAHSTHGLDYLILRLCHQFGPWQSHRFGFVPQIISSIIQKQPLELNASRTCDWLYVDETFRIINLLVEQNKFNDTINLTNEWEFSDLELYHLICEMLHEEERIILNKNGHLSTTMMSGERLKTIGYKPKCKFKEALNETVDWYIRNPWFMEISK